MDGGKVERSVGAIDVCDQLCDLGFQLGVLDQGRRCDLDQDDLTLHLRVVVQKLFESLKLLLDTLDQVELVATDNDTLVLVRLADSLHLGQDPGSFALALNPLGIDTNRECADPNSGSVGVDTTGC